jgi:lipopolysaccharide biosynthesis regulator YciM
MENDKAIEILKKMLDKPSLDTEEKEAVMTALGILGWVKLSKSRMKILKEKRDQSLKWP